MGKNNNIVSVTTHQYHFPSEILLADSPAAYFEFLNNATMRTGIYTLKAGEKEMQTPHTEDELYYVLQGKSSMQVGDTKFEVHEGDCVFVPAHLEHRFVDIIEELKLLVFFSKARVTNEKP